MDAGQIISHYELLSPLGGGGMGIVYKALDLKLERPVALKFLPAELSRDPEANARFMQEAKAASALDHPNICTIHEVGETDDGRLFIAMAFYEGKTLKRYLADRGPTDAAEAVDIVRQLGQGLAAAHEHGIVHRDIKPANIMITDSGLVKILDFGLAKLSGGLVLTRSGSTLGTAHYMAPEQIRGEEVDGRTDLWSLGVVLYEMLEGRRPFSGEYEQAIIYAILNESADRPGTGSDELHAVLKKLLDKDPSHRYASAKALLSDLQELPEVGPGEARSRPSHRRPPVPTIMIVSAVVLVAAVLSLLFLLPNLSGDKVAPETDEHTIAVMPFAVRGDPELEYLAEGLVDLLSLKLDGAGSLATVDPNALLGTIVKDNLVIVDPEDALDLAGKLGAARAILGRVTQVGDEIQLTASVYRDPLAPELEVTASVNGENDIMTGLDELSRDISRGLFDDPPGEITSLATLTTSSFAALKAFLQGERETRRVRFREALEHYEKAVAEDSTFALAWARMSWSAGWGIDVALEKEGLKRAMQYRSALPERARQTIELANFAFREGEPEKAIAIARSLLASRPNDLIALQLLGEILYHYNPYLGRSALESKEYFERALAIAPDHGESIPHLFNIALEERDFRSADSLSVLHMRVTGDRSMRDTYMRILSIANRVPGDTTWAFLDAGNQLPLGELGLVMPLVATALEDIDAVVRTLSRVAQYDRLPEPRRSGIKSILLASGVARGQPRRSQRFLDGPDDELQGFGLMMEGLTYAVPLYPISEEDLAALYDRIVAWDTVSHALHWNQRRQNIHVGQHAIVKDYLAGMIALRMKDEARLQVHLKRLQAVADPTTGDDLAYSSIRFIEAVRSWQRGDYDAALSAIEDARLKILWRDTHESPVTEQALNRFVQGELLKTKGQLEEAIGAYRSLVTQEYPTGIIFLGPSYIRLAEIYEELGEHTKAIEYYARLLRLWEDCDSELVPVRDAVEANLNRLMAETIREPDDT